MDFKAFMDKVVFKRNNQFEKNILKEVWYLNKMDFKNQIENLTGANLKTCDVVIDTSKSMYDDKLISVSFGVALLASAFGNRVIVNSYDPYLIEFDEKFDLFKNIERISKECAYYEKINFKEIFNKQLMKKKKIFAITNRPHIVPELEDWDDDKSIIYWEVTKDKQEMEYCAKEDDIYLRIGNFYKTDIPVNDMRNKNTGQIADILNDSDEIEDGYMDRLVIYGSFALLSVTTALSSYVIYSGTF